MNEEKPIHDQENDSPGTGNPDPSVEGTSAQADVAQLQKELEETRAKCQTYLDLAQRAQADFLNYKRRVEQERSDFMRSARAETILKMLPTLDDLERAVQSVPAQLAESDWVQGIILIERKLRATLETEGVKRIEAVGEPFDPWKEEALVHEPSEKFAQGMVSRVFRTGYVLDGRVIRPAQVIVSSGPPETAEETAADRADQDPSSPGGQK